MIKHRKIYITFLIIVLRVATSQAQDNSFEYNIIPSDSNLAVWINLSSFLTFTRIEDLNDGEQYSIYGMVSLNRPKKFYGSELIEKKDFLINTSFFILTEDYQVERIQNSEKDYYKFSTEAELHKFFSDSIFVFFQNMDKINKKNRYYLEINLDYIKSGLARYNSTNKITDKNSSPIKYLFGKFLEITGYGKTSQSFKSASFKIKDFEN